ncbi:dual specificity protein phosphatase CDC14B [Capsaspora owczarzaki ATCC 30864]|uniref:protein-tyrosine-phosphatase n=1 Tax=Capsaspora owczarzaki (strain ATCC 30864) TaxID=595528 RepID=A0A0D2WV03_CAPO3|nr:dual specificity protein phosphatase CDC14B [Capsaspora owczarzaki ATCC 30864]KJE95913.1 dual specificity protein phosphatase CDC14B [Capsaspora owczarzaki ATCC 30864]|eukprot:XP_004345055.1 dual specificity protein phosphatase CDC14B [Capsaspora owczarzaki ATCC 30864]
MVKEAKIPNPPSYIEFAHMRFLIMDAPSDSNLPAYITELKKHEVSDVVRVCDPTYNTEPLTRNDITVHDWPFVDGEAPPSTVTDNWLNLVNQRMSPAVQKEGKHPCIAVHCVAGLGRAPVLVAIALIEAGYEAEDAIELVRSKRKGAINNKQLLFLQKYKRRSKTPGKCIIS